MSKEKYCATEKLAILEEVSSGKIGFIAATKRYGMNKTTLMKWQRRYKLYGYEGLERSTRNRSYSAELKLQAVKDYVGWIVKIPDHRQIQDLKYNAA
ncbi:transposase [Paenibacillus mucilaginosus]|uniref:helix-turn-helix domain-containing protein n=1 Tax=Paenibacillus mucilaginosus TaxID=61624 RepID=UPI00240DDBD4|nr:helix-turn-helix domain-containing protein [Paenibacillus mucilaginosus]WFA17232.1 transposase [Paenibacillus mucilaginosus]